MYVNAPLDAAFSAGEIDEWYYYTHSPSFKASGTGIDVQGTSSQKYPRRNYKLKYKSAKKNWVYTQGSLKDKPLTEKYTVLDKDGVIWMSMKFNDIDYSPTFKDDYFNLDTIMSNYVIDDLATKEVTSLDDSIYPLAIPDGTKLVSEEKVKKDGGERIIMTFDGTSPFLLVEETANIEEEFTVIPTYGEPYQLMDTLGVITNNSLTWTSNGIEYYLVSDVMEQDELIKVAQSISSLPTMK